jgi:electron transport protein HydN
VEKMLNVIHEGRTKMITKLNSFIIADPSKCIGCKICEVACSIMHSGVAMKTAGMMETPVTPKLFLVQTAEVTMPIQCRHCEDAPCANVCPVAAITQENNVITVKEDQCIGCKTCLMACPFGAIDLVPRYKDGEEVMQLGLKSETAEGLLEKSMLVANKCDLCAGCESGPACVEACPEKALEIVTPMKNKKKRNQDAALRLLDSVKKFIG